MAGEDPRLCDFTGRLTFELDDFQATACRALEDITSGTGRPRLLPRIAEPPTGASMSSHGSPSAPTHSHATPVMLRGFQRKAKARSLDKHGGLTCSAPQVRSGGQEALIAERTGLKIPAVLADELYGDASSQLTFTSFDHY